MFKKSKFIFSLFSLFLCLSMLCFGVYSSIKVQFIVNGNIHYEVQKPVATVNKISSSGEIISNDDSTFGMNSVFSLDYNFTIKPKIDSIDDTHPQGQSTIIEIEMSSTGPLFARMFINYDTTQYPNIKVNASSLYLKGSGIYRIYIDNNTENEVSLDDLKLSIQYDVQTSILHSPDAENDYFYVEMGTIMRDGSMQNEYIKWRLIGKGSEYSSEYTIFNRSSASAPTSGVGVFILETNTQLKRPDTDDPDYTLNDVSFNNTYHYVSATDSNHSETMPEYDYDWTDIKANDYATSTIRRYINGVDIYKNH